MQYLKITGLVLGLSWYSGLHAELVAVQEAIEAHDVTVMLHGSGDGYVLARRCAACPFRRLEIDHRTVVTVDGEPAGIDPRIEKQWPGGIVIYDIVTRHVVRLKL
ncbi:MAG: hypothetical protein PVI50_04305 [Gammaproteobacteria bacterium]|jgi:hypothetical protein